jgi:hypothetical protein
LAAGLLWLGVGAVHAEPATALNCDGCVSSKDIKNGGVKTYDIRIGAINTSRLADGAVAKRKIAEGAVGAAQLGLARTYYLEDSGSETDNCYKLRDLLDGIDGPAAVVLGPGTYDCQRSGFLLPSHVSLIGSGQNLTTITGSEHTYFIRIGNGSALTDLTVINDDHAGPLGPNTAIYIESAENWRIANVTVKAMYGVESNAIWLRSKTCSGELLNVTAVALGDRSSRGIYVSCDEGAMTASNLNVSADGGGGGALVKVGRSIFTVRNSSFSGLNINILPSSNSYETLKLISSEVSGELPYGAICVGVYDEAGTALTNGTAGLGGCL